MLVSHSKKTWIGEVIANCFIYMYNKGRTISELINQKIYIKLKLCNFIYAVQCTYIIQYSMTYSYTNIKRYQHFVKHFDWKETKS